MEKTKGLHRAWLVMLGCGMLIAGSVTFYTVVIGNFFVPAAADLEADYSSISLYTTVVYLGIACGLPFVGNLLHKIPPAGIAGFAALQSAIVALLAFSDSIVFWWIGGFFIGVGMSFTSIVFISTVLTNWFTKKTGFAIGAAWGLASIVSAIMSPLSVTLMDAIGWRSAMIVFAAIGAALAIPAALFMVSYSPDRKGMKSYGYEQVAGAEGETEPLVGVPAKHALKSMSFVLVALALALTQIVSVINAYFPVYAESVGFAPTVGALMISVALIFDIVLNATVGATIDKVGAIRGFVSWMAVSVVAMVILMFSAGQPLLAYLGAGLGDALYVLLGVGIASVVSHVFGTKDYGKIFAYISMIGFAAGSVGGFVITRLYEVTGSFQMVFVFCIVVCVAICGCVLLANALGKKLPRVSDDSAIPDE
ncbi:MFS transporter [Slackia exigua]